MMRTCNCPACGNDFLIREPNPVERSQFIRDYVLARAGAVPVEFAGLGAAGEAALVYDKYIAASK